MKKYYLIPEIEVELIQTEDILTASGTPGDKYENDKVWDLGKFGL